MKFRVKCRGEDLGRFTLEELRLGRNFGTFNGAEYVQVDGMTDWQPLDLVLEHGYRDLRGPAGQWTPQSIPASAGGRNLIWGVVAALVFFLLGTAVFFAPRKRQSENPLPAKTDPPRDAAETAARAPVSWTKQTPTHREWDKRYDEFRSRQWLEGYNERGIRGDRTDVDARRLIGWWLRYGSRLAQGAKLGDQLASDPAVVDPLVLSIAGDTCDDTSGRRERFERAVKGFEKSDHRAFPRFFATVKLIERVDDEPARAGALNGNALQLLARSFSDGSFKPEDQPCVAEILVYGWGRDFFRNNHLAIPPLVRTAGRSNEWLTLVLEGESQIIEAWKVRVAAAPKSMVSKEGREFHGHLRKAREALTGAWRLRPDLPLAPCRMIEVAEGDSGITEMREWFDRAITAQFDYENAWALMRWGLRTDHHGNAKALMAFGDTAINTLRFDTEVPAQYSRIVNEVASELRLGPGEFIYGRRDIWPTLGRMYEGYLADESQASRRANWRSSYAVVAFLAGKYGVSRTQLEKLNWKPEPFSLTRWGVDLSFMPLEVAARTSPLAETVTAAETARRNGELGDAIKFYTRIAGTNTADSRLSEFASRRVASLDVEQDLRRGEWVDFMPAKIGDPNWVALRGTTSRAGGGVLEIESGSAGHCIFSEARVGPDFEVRGEFDLVQSTTGDFQAGLVIGIPDLEGASWYSFRMRRSLARGDDTTLGRRWNRPLVIGRAHLRNEGNSFVLVYRKGKVTATLNGEQVLHEAVSPRTISVPGREIKLGFGAYNDMNSTVIRYRNVQVRSPSGEM